MTEVLAYPNIFASAGIIILTLLLITGIIIIALTNGNGDDSGTPNTQRRRAGAGTAPAGDTDHGKMPSLPAGHHRPDRRPV